MWALYREKKLLKYRKDKQLSKIVYVQKRRNLSVPNMIIMIWFGSYEGGMKKI